jgi:ribonuclease P/MRP protein subunit POP5
LLKKTRARYLALTIDSEGMFGSREFMSAVWDAVLRLYGEYGASRTGLALIDYDAEKKLAILRTVHTTVDMVRAALASITKIRDKPVVVHVLAVSGTIKALSEKIRQ